MPSIAQLNKANQAAFTNALRHLFERSSWVAEETWAKRPFRDVEHLYAELCATMRGASPERQAALIRAHPDLASRLGKLTPESAREQASAGLDAISPKELAAFQKLNDAYKARFGFPFIICARLHARAAILKAMQSRLPNPIAEEFDTALAEIEKIARLRLDDILKPV